MKYYLCIVGSFEGGEAIYKECIDRGFYQYYDETRQKGAVSFIRPGDILILSTNKQLKGYGVAEGAAVDGKKGHDEHWCSIKVRDGWQLIDDNLSEPIPYGVYWHTIRGTKQSIVKELDSMWASEILLRIKQLRREGIEDQAFTIHLSELARGRNTPQNYYRIPDIQRGFVWNATRCEVLWDSILRRIPIGAICVRPAIGSNTEPQWEILDGQQRSSAAAMGYAEWPKERGKSILWIDLKPKDTHGRKFVLMLTTPAHPWGYNLSNDEKADNRLRAYEQRDAVEKLCGAWKPEQKGARPDTTELWPVKAGLPVPFSLLRQYIESQPSEGVIKYSDFFSYCHKHFSTHNWICVLHYGCFSESGSLTKSVLAPSPADQVEPEQERWKSIVDAVRQLSTYTVVAMNCHVESDDLGLYFKRMNKQGVEPDDEEIRYSLLKSKIPSLKKLDSLPIIRTRPAWLADIAIRFWLSQHEKWEWKRSVSLKDIDRISCREERDHFKSFVVGNNSNGFQDLLTRLDAILLKGEACLLPWHLKELYMHGQGDCLVLYLLRELSQGRPTDFFIAWVTTIMWFGNDIPKCAECLWEAPTIQMGLFRAIQQGYLVSVFNEQYIENWAKAIKRGLCGDDWGNGDVAGQDPYIGQALNRIWDGFHGGAGCSFLLFACRKFITDYFGTYDTAKPEWREQNRPWDYDHILPQNWVEKKRVSGLTYLVQKFLWSVGNSAPLPFSLNRGKNASAPDNYPDNTHESAKNLHVDWTKVNQFGKDKGAYNLLGKSKPASKHFVEACVDRILSMFRDWYAHCHIGELMSFENCEDPRRQLFASLLIDDEFNDATVWFVNGGGQYEIGCATDLARPWLVCGMCGTALYQEKDIPCLLGVASNGKVLQLGIRRHPSERNIPDGEWWLGSLVDVLDLKNIEIVDVVERLKGYREKFRFRKENCQRNNDVRTFLLKETTMCE